MRAAKELSEEIGVLPACEAMGVSRASFYRERQGKGPTRPRPKPKRALSEAEREAVLAVCHSEEFVDRAPRAIQAVLMDRGIYLCSSRTMYRLLDETREVKERRNQARHPAYVKPELCAMAPNQVWSWDITDLKGPVRGSRFKLYVTIDLFSRLVAGWTVQEREDEALAKEFHRQTFIQNGIQPGELTLHSDRGAAMVSKTVATLLTDLGYIQQDRDETEVLFTLLAERYERRTVILTSNLVFSQWDRIFKDPMTTAAAIDRVIHHCVILELNGTSFRAEAAKARMGPARESATA